MSKVIDLKSRFVQKQEIVFSCVACGGQAFWLNEGGTITCRTCSVKQKVDVDWLKDAIQLHAGDGEFEVTWEEPDEDE